MKTFTWSAGTIKTGIAVRADERLGQVVFLGEEERGRRYEKVALGRRNPAEVVNGRVLDAHPVKITLPAKDGKPEKGFYVLEKPRNGGGDETLVRVYTYTSYIRGGQGCWRIIAGKPQTLITGYGAFGDAGRIGNWDDGLVVMRPGDVLRVYPSRGSDSYALWLENGQPVTTTWQDYENIQAVARAQALVERAADKPDALNVVFGQMRAFTFADGQITKGLRVAKGATGPVVALGESGRGRSIVEVPLVGLTPVVQNDQTEIVEEAAVAKLDEKEIPARWYWESKIKTIYGLTQAARREEAFLVRVSTASPYRKGSTGAVDPWKGSPAVLTATYVGGGEDVLLVMREGDVLFVRQAGKSAGPWALFVKEGDLRAESWHPWKVKDAARDPAFYVAKGTAPMGHVPSEWAGQVVTPFLLMEEESGYSYLRELATGELVRIEQNSVVLNLGWDGQDYHEQSVSGSWVVLDKGKRVRRLEGEEAEKRKLIRIEAEALRAQAEALTSQPHFELAEATLRREAQEIAEEQGFDTKPTEGYGSLTSWVKQAQEILARFAAAEQELKALEQRQSSGEILVRFGGLTRRAGSTGNQAFWVVRPDGSCREHDSINYPKSHNRGTPTVLWERVEPEELALRWAKSCSAASHEFEVVKLPVDGCTQEQLSTVEKIQQKLDDEWRGRCGLASGIPSPPVGQGWGLRKKPEPQPEQEQEPAPKAPAPAPAVESKPVDLSQVDLGKLFGGAMKTNGRR